MTDRPSTSEGPEWVTLIDASEATGITVGALAHWCREGVVSSQMARTSEGEQRLVSLPHVIKKLREKSPDLEPETTIENALQPLVRAIPDLIRDLGDARERAARAEAKVEFLTQRLAELKGSAVTFEDRSQEPEVEASYSPRHGTPPPLPPRDQETGLEGIWDTGDLDADARVPDLPDPRSASSTSSSSAEREELGDIWAADQGASKEPTDTLKEQWTSGLSDPVASRPRRSGRWKWRRK